jgi:hypothetical protein
MSTLSAIAPSAKSSVAPVTPADVKRAAYFGLRIPALAKVEPVVVAPVVEVKLAPTPRPARFVPTQEMEAEVLGYELGFTGEDAQPPAGWDFGCLVAFYEGFLAGKAALEAEYNEWLDALAAEHDRMEEAFGGPEDTWHEAELAEAGSRSGHPAHEG